MVIPTRRRCLDLMKQAKMPEHIRKHSFVVAEIAVYLGGLLYQNNICLNLPLLEAGALLHDIAKDRSLATGERHEKVGAKMVEDWGYPLLSPIVKEHVVLDHTILHGPITESLLVNYADKRVKHDQIVSLGDRFFDLIDRYAKTEEHRAWLLEKLHLYGLLESKIFEHLTLNPNDLCRVAGSGASVNGNLLA